MLRLDDDEAEIVLAGLKVFRIETTSAQARTSVDSAAWRSCRYVVAKCDLLIARIKQYQKDEAEEKADG